MQIFLSSEVGYAIAVYQAGELQLLCNTGSIAYLYRTVLMCAHWVCVHSGMQWMDPVPSQES